MKRSPADPLEEYGALIERYHPTLDLLSQSALASLDRLLGEGRRYGELVSRLSPTGGSVLDLGSGVGLPGIPVALANPGSHVMLVERRRRRVSFLRIAVSQLSLANVAVAAGDVRSLALPCADVVTAQGVGKLSHVYALTRHLQGELVWLVSRKGEGWNEELDGLEAETGAAPIEVHEEELPPHGRLVAVLMPGGDACPPSG